MAQGNFSRVASVFLALYSINDETISYYQENRIIYIQVSIRLQGLVGKKTPNRKFASRLSVPADAPTAFARAFAPSEAASPLSAMELGLTSHAAPNLCRRKLR